MEKHNAHAASLEQEQETLWYLGGLRIIAALRELPARSSHLVEYREPSGTYTSSYSPRPEETAFYLAEGEGTFFSAGEMLSAPPGTFLFLPRHLSFRYQIGQSGPARIITWTTNSGFARQVLQMGQPDQALVLAPPMLGSLEKRHQLTALLQKMLETAPAQRNGL
jgi:hypothetical protein